MKKITRIFSVVMALVLMLSVAVLPVNAAVPSDADVSFRLELSPETERKDSTGADPVANNVYRLDIFLTSNVRVSTIIMGVTFDSAIFTPLDACDEYIYTTDRSAGYVDVLSEWRGPLLEVGSVKSGRDTFYDPSNSAVKSAYKSAFTDNDDGILLWNYKPADKSAMIGMCTDEKVASVYLKLNAGQTAEGAKFGFGIGQGTSAKSVGFCSNPELGKYFKMASADLINILPLDLIGTPDYTYTAAVAAGPALNYETRQVKMELDAEKNVVDKSEQFRVISYISSEDWGNYFSNTGVVGSADENKILEVGFVAYKGDEGAGFNLATAKDIAEGKQEASGLYSKATTTYIQHETKSDTYRFGVRVQYKNEGVFDTTYVPFVHYLDASGNDAYMYYTDDSLNGRIDFKTNYDTIVNTYKNGLSKA